MHEVPQELGDFGVLVHSGWSRRAALLWNFASASTFLLGGLLAYGLADTLDVSVLLPFAAGNFIYIGASDLLPEVASQPSTRDKIESSAAFLVGLLLLLAVVQVA